MKKLSNQGFSLIEALIIFLVVGALGFGGWRIYDARHKKSSSAKVTTSQTNPSPAANPPASEVQRAVYSATVGKFTLSLDPKYTIIVRHYSGGEGCATTQLIIGNKDKTNSNVVYAETYTGVSVSAYAKGCTTVKDQANSDTADFQSKISLLGKDTTKVGPWGIGDGAQYYFENNGVVYKISCASDSEAKPIFDDVIAGWTFN
jgi:Tfp pilus assembly protein PilX